MICEKCGNMLQWCLDTLICPRCDHDTLYELGYISQDLKDMEKDEGVK